MFIEIAWSVGGHVKSAKQYAFVGVPLARLNSVSTTMTDAPRLRCVQIVNEPSFALTSSQVCLVQKWW